MLRDLYTEVLVPSAVGNEVARHPAVELHVALASGWLKRVTPGNGEQVDQIEADLGGRGEAEVIGVALELESAIVLIDERAVRTYAQARGLQVRGTLGVILHAKRLGLIGRATPLFDDLRRSGFWLDEITYRRARELASEP